MVAQFDAFQINPIHNGDAWKICNFIVANADRLKRYFPKTLEQNLNPTLSQLFVDKMVKQFQNRVVFLFTLKHSETRALAGLIYIKEIDWDKKQGLTSKAVNALSKHAFTNLGLETLQIISHKNNLPSIKVALNTNFKWQRTLKNEFTPTGEQPLDMELYELYK